MMVWNKTGGEDGRMERKAGDKKRMREKLERPGKKGRKEWSHERVGRKDEGKEWKETEEKKQVGRK